MKNFVILVFTIALIFSCNDSTKKTTDPQFIIDKAIEASNKKELINTDISFKFRDYIYTSEGHCNHFVFYRKKEDSTNSVTDIYEPKHGLKRYINDSLVKISDSLSFKYAESINSVLYFVQLPYRLNDEAVNKTYLGKEKIKEKTYYKIKVTFEEEGGGTDYEDNYIYWFNIENYKLDYLAYSFTVNGGGMRFREAYNERYVDGIRFIDYKNYKPKDDKKIELKEISRAFKNDEVELLSYIENENILVKKEKKKC